MKNLITILLIALSATVFGQHTYNGPQVFNGTLAQNGALTVGGTAAFNATVSATALFTFSGGQYLSSAVTWNVEKTVARNYTIIGTVPIVVDSAEFTNDTLKLVKTNYAAGQIITIITTAATNDTLTLLHDGYYQGATATALIGAATSASYKQLRIYVDAYKNYWKIN